MQKEFDGNIDLEAEVRQILPSHWDSHVPKAKLPWRHVDWRNPVAIEMVSAQVEQEIDLHLSKIERLRKIQSHLDYLKNEMSQDGVLFFDDLLPLELWPLIEGTYLYDGVEGTDIMQRERLILEYVGRSMPKLVTKIISTMLKELE